MSNSDKQKITTIIRVVHNRQNPFVQLSKEALWDSNLSLRAVGLWARCMSRPDNWKFCVRELIKNCKEGRDTVYKAIQELIDAGYAIRIMNQEKIKGKFSKGCMEYVFFEFAATEEEKQEQIDKFKKSFRLPENQDTGNQDTADQDLLIKKEKEKEEDKEKKTTKEKKKIAVGNRGGGVFFDRSLQEFKNITDEWLTELKRTFPGMDIARQLALMRLWLIDPDNPRRIGNSKFIVGWLSRQIPISGNFDTSVRFTMQPEPVLPVNPHLQRPPDEDDI